MNRIDLKANLGQDPKPLGDNGHVFSLALSNDYKKNDEWVKQDPTWIDVKCWRKLSEKARKLKKGDRVHVVGKLKHEEYEGKVKHHVYALEIDKIDNMKDPF